ncbi:MAG: type I secretion system permease/ATPase [Desulfovermiculus sp.]
MEKELKKILIVAGGLSVFVVLLTLSMPFSMIMLFRWVIPSESISSIKVIASAALAGLLFMTVFDVLRFALLRRFALYLNNTLGEKILLGMFKDRAKQQKGEHSSAMNDLSRVRSFLTSPTSTAFLDAMISPLQLAIVFFISPLMGVLALLCILIILGTKFLGRKGTRELLRSANQRFARANAFAQECVYNSQAVQAMGMQPQVISRWRSMQDEMVRDQTEASEKAGIHSASTKSMGWIMQVLLMGVGFSLILSGQLGSGFAIIAVIIAGRVIMPMQMVVNGWEEYQNAKDAFARLKEFLSELRSQEEETKLELPRPEGRLKAESLVYGLGGKPIIKGISFDLEPGSTLGLIGPSGAGKTTLARLLTGAVRPQSGVLRLDGADMHQWDQDRLGPFVGYLPQEVELFAGSIGQNIARFQEAEQELVEKAAVLAGVHETIVKLPDGYDTVLEEQGQNLPGGLRQRIGLARAMFGDPRLIILDEPDASLDQAGLQALQEILHKAKEQKITLILVTHRQKLLLYTDKLLMLKSGQVSLYGPSKQVLQKLLPQSQKK